MDMVASKDSLAHFSNVFRQRLVLETAKMQEYSWSYIALQIASCVSPLILIAAASKKEAHAQTLASPGFRYDYYLQCLLPPPCSVPRPILGTSIPGKL